MLVHRPIVYTSTHDVSVQIKNGYVYLAVHIDLDDGTTAIAFIRRTPHQARDLAGRLLSHAAHVLPMRCLYCGDGEDIYETRVVIDDRTDEYALKCGNCGGVWTS